MMFVCLGFFLDCWGSQMLDHTTLRDCRVSICGEIQNATALRSQKDLEQAIDTLSIISSIKTEGS